MKQLITITIIFLFFNCQKTTSSNISPSTEKIKLRPLEKLHIVGDFDGDKKQDSLFQGNFSKLTMSEIDSSANPFENEWDTVVQWFYEQESDVYLSLKGFDTLHLGTGQGLYCLLNIGDNNHDGKDEIALVVDYCDFSNVNTCKIYSLCNQKWILLNHFYIYEGAFDWEKHQQKAPIFKEIKGFLEKKGKKWFFLDYLEPDYETEEEVGKMKLLETKTCN